MNIFVCLNGISKRWSSQFQMEELASEDQSIVVGEDMPVIDDMDEKSTTNRVAKAAGQVSQSQPFAEFDLFGSDLTLNYEGESRYKTELGGMLYLIVMIVSITLTIIYVFPNGIGVFSHITSSPFKRDGGSDLDIFEHSDTLMRIYYYNRTSRTPLTGNALKFYIREMQAWQNINGKGVQRLELIPDYNTGYFYFNKTATNANAKIYQDSGDMASIRIEVKVCNFMDSDPVYGICMNNFYSKKYVLAVDVKTFDPVTNGITQKWVTVPFVMNDQDQVVTGSNRISYFNMDIAQFTTNSMFWGYIANVMSYEIDYYKYEVDTMIKNHALYPPTRADSYFATFRNQCNSTYVYTTFTSTYPDGCIGFDLQYSGSTFVVNQVFDNITAPMVFFLSLSQTLIYLIYFFFLGNYSNNCFLLALADSVVFIRNPEGRHYNFKEGAAVFLGCMVHNHFFIRGLDAVLYRFWETHSRRFFPVHTQMTMDMIDYGYSLMVDRNFYGQLNDMFAQENSQPQKIIFDYEVDEEAKKKQEQEDAAMEQPERYFDDDVKEQAFRRMCEEHEHFSVKNRLHLKSLLLETGKRYKLVLIAQNIFEDYCTRVRNEQLTKEVELPIVYQNEELSGHSLKKENFY